MLQCRVSDHFAATHFCPVLSSPVPTNMSGSQASSRCVFVCDHGTTPPHSAQAASQAPFGPSILTSPSGGPPARDFRAPSTGLIGLIGRRGATRFKA